MIADTLVLPAATNSAQALQIAPLATRRAGLILQHVAGVLLFGSSIQRAIRACEKAAKKVDGLSSEDLVYQLDRLAIDDEILDGLTAFSEMAKTTPFMFIVGAYTLVSQFRSTNAGNRWGALPPVAALAMTEGCTYADELQKISRTIRAEDRVPRQEAATTIRDLQGLIYDPNTPTAVAELILKFLRIPPSLLALSGLMIAGKSQSGTIVQLAQGFRDGQLAALQIFASRYPKHVPETLLPSSLRIDIDQLLRDTAQYWAEHEQLSVEGE